MKIWKKIMALAMGTVLVFGISGCKEKEPESDEIEIEAVEEPEEIPEASPGGLTRCLSRMRVRRMGPMSRLLFRSLIKNTPIFR